MHNGRNITYAEFNDAINTLCSVMSMQVSEKDRIAIAIRSKYEFLVAMVAALRIGKSVVPLNTGLPDEALKINLGDADVSFLVHDNNFERITSLLKGSNSTVAINIDRLDLTKMLRNRTDDKEVSRQPTDEWGVLFSSGTTGVPKGIARDQNSMVTEFLGWCLELGLNRTTSFYLGRPIFYTGGVVLAFSTLLVGGAIILNDFIDDNDPTEVWANYQRTLSSHDVSWAFFVPDQIRAFTSTVETGGSVSNKAENILVMGAPITGQEKINAKRSLASDIVESWGNSESLGTITDPEDLEVRPNSIGRPFVTDELYIVDDSLNLLPANERGRIAGNEEAGFFGYCNRPDETERVKQEKLIVSEDIGHTDVEGFFYISAREQECVIIDGETVMLPSIEQKLRQNPIVKDLCVVAIGSEDAIVELVALIVRAHPQAAEDHDLLGQLNALLLPSERLGRLVHTESLPKVPAGKVDRPAAERLAKEVA
jgi:acyl-coenzyme A synthetase/AMP-(fatty) acid ligase